MSRVTTTVGVARGVGVAAAVEGLAVVTGGDDGDTEAPAAQPPSRKVRARPMTSRTAAPRAFTPDLLRAVPCSVRAARSTRGLAYRTPAGRRGRSTPRPMCR